MLFEILLVVPLAVGIGALFWYLIRRLYRYEEGRVEKEIKRRSEREARENPPSISPLFPLRGTISWYIDLCSDCFPHGVNFTIGAEYKWLVCEYCLRSRTTYHLNVTFDRNQAGLAVEMRDYYANRGTRVDP